MLIDRAKVRPEALGGKVAVITGAGQGIGREAARALARLGATVVIAEINSTGRETEQAIEAAGGRALFVQTDISDPGNVERLRRQAMESFGRVDILVNNAAAYTTKSILEHTVEEWDRVFAVNLRGAFLGVKTFLPGMLERRDGVIVTMESAEGMPYLAPYLASKVGLRSLALSLAQEVGDESGVSVFCFGPGIVSTPGGLGAFERLAPRYGMELGEFIRQAGIQMVPPELCATGLAGTILYARDFHGQETSYVPGLVKLGLDREVEAEELPPAAPHGTEASGETLPRSDALGEVAVARNRMVEEVLRTYRREFDELTIFQRPIVRRMFQQGTGLKIEEWMASAQEMTARLERLSSPESSGDALPVRSEIARYAAQLERLAGYVDKQQGDARGWIKDAQKLEVALAALVERAAVVREANRALATALGSAP